MLHIQRLWRTDTASGFLRASIQSYLLLPIVSVTNAASGEVRSDVQVPCVLCLTSVCRHKRQMPGSQQVHRRYVSLT